MTGAKQKPEQCLVLMCLSSDNSFSRHRKKTVLLNGKSAIEGKINKNLLSLFPLYFSGNYLKMPSIVGTRKQSSQYNTEQSYVKCWTGINHWMVKKLQQRCLSAKEWKNRLSSLLCFPCETLCCDYMPAPVKWLALDTVVLYIQFSSSMVKKQSPQFHHLYLAWSLVLFHLLCNLLLIVYYEGSQPNPQSSPWVVKAHFPSIFSQRYRWTW